jgi:hypothetical protein
MTFGRVEYNYSIFTTKLFEVSLKWWKTYRPKGFTLSQHLENPCINMKRKEDRELAKEIATILRDEGIE